MLFNAKSTWTANDVVHKVIGFICFSRGVDHVALEIKVEEEESGSFIHYSHDDVAFLGAARSRSYPALI